MGRGSCSLTFCYSNSGISYLILCFLVSVFKSVSFFVFISETFLTFPSEIVPTSPLHLYKHSLPFRWLGQLPSEQDWSPTLTAETRVVEVERILQISSSSFFILLILRWLASHLIVEAPQSKWSKPSPNSEFSGPSCCCSFWQRVSEEGPAREGNTRRSVSGVLHPVLVCSAGAAGPRTPEDLGHLGPGHSGCPAVPSAWSFLVGGESILPDVSCVPAVSGDGDGNRHKNSWDCPQDSFRFHFWICCDRSWRQHV